MATQSSDNRGACASTKPATAMAVALIALLSLGQLHGAVAQKDGFIKGRATRYGGQDDWWNINEGSCGYGYLDKDKATGWDVAAISDCAWDYQGSCGRCYEVKCDPEYYLKDNYGQTFDRSNACRDSSASVIVQVTDTCPCHYPANEYSNKRWCCGDMYHMDLSTWAFEKLAENKWGVIGVQIRQVSCSTQPWKKAYTPPEGESPENKRISRPWGWSDRRPWN